MSRLVADRLWPVIVVLAVLLAGALLLEGYAARRGNDIVRIAITGGGAGLADAGDEEGAPEGPVDIGRTPPVSALHARARRAARRAQVEEAIALYEKALAAAPGARALPGELGAVLLAAGRPEEALRLLERADRLAPGPQSALRLGVARDRLGDLAGAEREYRRALSLRPGYGAARLALGTLMRRRGDVHGAVALLQDAVRSGSNEDRARALVALGAAYLADGRRADAESAFERAIQFAPARAEIRLGVARAWLGTDEPRDVERAIQVLLRAAEMAPDVPQVHAALGRARERSGDAAAAVEAYERALRLDPTYRYARRRLLRVALHARDFARARHEAERLVAEAPDVPEHQFLVGFVADREGRDDDARAAYRKAIEVAGGDYPEAYLNLGNLEKSAGNRAAARAAYEKAIALRPRYTAAYHNLAKLLEASGDLAGAEATYRKALAIDPGHASAWLSLGQLWSRAGRAEEAIEALKRAIAARPGYDAAELSLGVAYRRAGRFEDAIAAYRNLLERSPRYVSAWYNLALSLQARGKDADARAALERALGLEPEHVPSLVAMAALDLGAGRLADARREISDALDLAPRDVAARAVRAELAAAEGDRRGCEERARELRRSAGGDPRVQDLTRRCAEFRRSAVRAANSGVR